MQNQYRGWPSRIAAALVLGLATASPSVFAAAGAASTSVSKSASTDSSNSSQTTPSMQNLTNLATLSTAVTGLTDSTFASQEASYQQPLTSATGWRGFSHQTGRDITLTFNKPVDVQKIQLRALQNPALGIYFPDYVQYEFQVNGQWVTAGKRPSGIPQSGQKVMTQAFDWSNSAGVETTAVRIYIPVSVWVFVDGLKVEGSTAQSGATATNLTPLPAKTADIGPLSPQSPGAYGIQNMLLVETGAYSNQGLWSESDFEPMLAYQDQSGKVSGSLFDTILFLPYGSVADSAAGWRDYMSNLFAPNQQLTALNQAVAKTNDELKRPGYQEKVVLTIPYFPYGTRDFGMVNGQDINFGGSNSDPNAVTARTTALNWYLSTLLQQWKQADLKNLKLVGLYWDEEQYHDASPGEADYTKAAVNAAHTDGLPLFWIPFYGADKTDAWKSLGFDTAWIQPNYVEQGNAADVIRISNAMETAKKAGMGVEVELTGLDSSNQQLYNTFLQKLNSEGFAQGQVSHAFYDGSKLLVTAANSTDPTARAAYDATAAFIQGK